MLFQHPARAALARGGRGALPCGADPHDGDDTMTTRLIEWGFTLVGMAALGLVIAGCMHPLASAPDVRTPYPTVRALLELANVTGKDVVYDLGSGDGRIVITAARELGARGVGVEIDPALVAESRATARRLGLSSRVRFVEQDIF